ncbi:Colicin V production protein [Caloramator mitchellensis]|uniref:Colicin V production protein n=1 Tax=Caloramator mitchellensis TaxID=908809 RepID=A0A0R3JR68_CALMK|nr:CvpA family protein [Caloramator mitchellensis]KRQ85959.1 Colicin V production protein [Caloramator mitchellensis]
MNIHGFNIVDFVILLLILYGCIDGMQRGFIASLLKVLSIVFSIYFAKVITPYITSFIIYNTPIYNQMQNVFLKKMSLNASAALSILNLVGNKEKIAQTVTLLFLNAACYFFAFLILTIIFSIIRDNIRIKTRRSKIGIIDKLLGLGLGFVKWIFIIFLILAIITPVVSVLPNNNAFKSSIETSKIAKYFYNYNIIFPIIKKIEVLKK